MRYSGHHLTAYDFARNGRIDWRRVRRRLCAVRNGQYVSAHLPAEAELFEILAELGYRSLFALRDPRDAAVSDMHYIASFRRHPLHQAMTALPAEERLRAVICGMPGSRRGVPLLESMAQRLDDYRGWLTAPNTRTVRFEALIGERGGGESSVQTAEVMAIAAHVGRFLSPEEAGRVAARVWSPASSTFRRGVIGEWKRQFSDEDSKLVKQLAGDRLIAFGYDGGEAV
jgi:hypothetical protein